jgi:hypothetical protein
MLLWLFSFCICINPFFSFFNFTRTPHAPTLLTGTWLNKWNEEAASFDFTAQRYFEKYYNPLDLFTSLTTLKFLFSILFSCLENGLE